MKHLLLFGIATFYITLGIHAQVGIGTTTPDASSVLDISATDKGVLIPKVSLSDISDIMLDGVNNAATGLLIYNTNAGTIGGTGEGYYYFNGSIWEQLATSASAEDHDFYEEGTTTAPDDINDDQFTMGNVAIGKNTADYPLDIENSISERGVNVLLNGTSNNLKFGNRIEISNTGSGYHYGSYNTLSGTGTGRQYGIYNFIDNSGVENHYGSYNFLSGTGTGIQYGAVNFVDNSGNGLHFGNWTRLQGAGTGQQTGNYINITNSGNATHYGEFIRLEGNGTGTHNGTEVQLSGSGSGAQLGTINVIDNSGNGLHYGNYNVLRGTGTGAHYGNWARLEGTGTGVQYGNRLFITNSSNSNHYADFTNLSGSGDGDHYVSYSVLDGGGTGDHYGDRTWLQGAGTGQQTGNYIDISNTGNNVHYGELIYMRGSGSGGHYGINSTLSGTGSGIQVGNYTEITNSGNATHFGSRNLLSGTGSGPKYGVYSTIVNTAGGTHYGLYSEALKAGSFAGYFLGNVSIGTTNGNNYILPASRGTNGQIMQTDGSGNASWANDPSPSYWLKSAGVLNLATATDDIAFTSDQTSITFPSTTGTPSSMIYMFQGAGNVDRMVLSHSPSYPDWGMEYEDTTDSFIFKSSTQERLEIDLSGGFPLRVYGTARAVAFQSDTNTYPDYVFESYFQGHSKLNSNYSFKTLAELELFIKENGHLPNVKSYQEVKDEGMTINVGDMTVTNLEKIEEAFLYIIELKKQNDVLQKKIESQQQQLDEIKNKLQKQ